MRKLLLLRRVPVFALMVLAIFACSSGFKLGSLGAVEIERGQPIEIRALLSDSVVPSVSPLLRTAIEMAIKDFGPIHGHHVSVETLDEMCSGAGGRATAEAVVADAQVVGVIGTLCSGAAVEAAPISPVMKSLSDQSVSGATMMTSIAGLPSMFATMAIARAASN